MTELTTLLAYIGYDERPQQTRLFEHLIRADNRGVIAQAGTGVGKSLAVLAAASHAYKQTGIQSLVVTPTRVLMDQYMAKDAPNAAVALDIDIAELRGRAHYYCARTEERSWGEDYERGCQSSDVKCTEKAAFGECEHGTPYDQPCMDIHCEGPEDRPYVCEYQYAKRHARIANVVVTNTDFWVVNDRLLAGLGMEIFDVEGAVFVDEAHQLDAKLRDWAAKSLNARRVGRLETGGQLSKWILRQEDGIVEKTPELMNCLAEVARTPREGLKQQQEEQVDGAIEIMRRLETPHPSCIVHVKDEAIKTDWVDVSGSAAGLLTARPFGLVSATVPGSMASSLGVPDAPFTDVGHPFDYATQATLGISSADGSYRSSRFRANLEYRADELMLEIDKARGGALLLFSSFQDMRDVHDYLEPMLRKLGLTVLKQGGDVPNDELARQFKVDGNAVLFGSESFATGFDVPGDALRLVAIWKLPYPGKDPVTEATMKKYYVRYRDQMLMRVVQGIGRLIRSSDDRGRVWICDSRAEAVVSDRSPMTLHLREFRRGA